MGVTEQNIFEVPPTSYPHGTAQHLTINGLSTWYWEYGNPEGEPLLLIHGFRGDHHGLELIGSYLSEYRIIIPDLPGFGITEPFPSDQHNIDAYGQWLHALILTLSNEHRSIYLVGHSFGSIICSYTASTYPQHIKKLSLINPISQYPLKSSAQLLTLAVQGYYWLGAHLPPIFGLPLLRSKSITRVMSEIMMKTKNPLLRSFINTQHRLYFGSFASAQSVYEAYQISTQHTATEYIAQVPIPVHMVVAEKDDLGTLETQQEMYQKIRRGKMDIIPEVGHLIHYETPRYAAQLIRSFIMEESA
ncbi:alpha/beta fold hydrolase [Rothia sp. CCM 9419]|uniref:alpha/beta fold hydrolase n=1 Tax=Rothia sp. CCM 9419 TaxID=3402662 RepID=UPI003ADEEBB4